MSDRLYTMIVRNRKDVYKVFDFETRIIREQEEDPQPYGDITLPPFYVNPETFDGITERILELDKLRDLTDRRMAGSTHIIQSLDPTATRKRLKQEQQNKQQEKDKRIEL